jgi:ankyrin repeat protein
MSTIKDPLGVYRPLLLLIFLNGYCILQSGETALYLACYEGKPEIVSLLLKAGARTDIQEEVVIV